MTQKRCIYTTQHGQHRLGPLADTPWYSDANIEGEDQESRLRGDHVWKDSTDSNKEIEIEGDDQENRRWYHGIHGWLDSTVGTGKKVVEGDHQESGMVWRGHGWISLDGWTNDGRTNEHKKNSPLAVTDRGENCQLYVAEQGVWTAAWAAWLDGRLPHGPV